VRGRRRARFAAAAYRCGRAWCRTCSWSAVAAVARPQQVVRAVRAPWSERPPEKLPLSVSETRRPQTDQVRIRTANVVTSAVPTATSASSCSCHWCTAVRGCSTHRAAGTHAERKTRGHAAVALQIDCRPAVASRRCVAAARDQILRRYAHRARLRLNPDTLRVELDGVSRAVTHREKSRRRNLPSEAARLATAVVPRHQALVNRVFQ
jgi:hypothetical protein